MALAYKELQDLDRSKENLIIAIKLQPGNREIRNEYDALIKAKTTKE
jgi:Tfp pilus assembly protein PilF